MIPGEICGVLIWSGASITATRDDLPATKTCRMRRHNKDQWRWKEGKCLNSGMLQRKVTFYQMMV
jgi:hypothetical protein